MEVQVQHAGVLVIPFALAQRPQRKLRGHQKDILPQPLRSGLQATAISASPSGRCSGLCLSCPQDRSKSRACPDSPQSQPTAARRP